MQCFGEGKNYLEDLDVDGSIILKLIFSIIWAWTGSIWVTIGTRGDRVGQVN